MVCCAVLNCKNNSTKLTKNRDGITFHRFPRIYERCRQWEIAINRGAWVSTRFSAVCSDHFEYNDFYETAGGNRKLFPNAVPSLKLPQWKRSGPVLEISPLICSDPLESELIIKPDPDEFTEQDSSQIIELHPDDVITHNPHQHIKTEPDCLEIEISQYKGLQKNSNEGLKLKHNERIQTDPNIRLEVNPHEGLKVGPHEGLQTNVNDQMNPVVIKMEPHKIIDLDPEKITTSETNENKLQNEITKLKSKVKRLENIAESRKRKLKEMWSSNKKLQKKLLRMSSMVKHLIKIKDTESVCDVMCEYIV